MLYNCGQGGNFGRSYIYTSEKAVTHFIDKVTLSYESLQNVIGRYKIHMLDGDEESFKNHDACGLCKEQFKSVNNKNRHHDHHH